MAAIGTVVHHLLDQLFDNFMTFVLFAVEGEESRPPRNGLFVDAFDVTRSTVGCTQTKQTQRFPLSAPDNRCARVSSSSRCSLYLFVFAALTKPFVCITKDTIFSISKEAAVARVISAVCSSSWYRLVARLYKRPHYTASTQPASP